MSEYDFYEGADAAGSEPVGEPDAFGDAFAGSDLRATDLDAADDYADPDTAYGDGYGSDLNADLDGDSALDTSSDLDGGPDAGAGLDAEPADTGSGGLFDDLDLHFDLANLDLDNLDLSFDASYDLIGSSPDETGWWEALTSDSNHDGAYETVPHDTDPYVTY
jgi:hypothetical protein